MLGHSIVELRVAAEVVEEGAEEVAAVEEAEVEDEVEAAEVEEAGEEEVDKACLIIKRDTLWAPWLTSASHSQFLLPASLLHMFHSHVEFYDCYPACGYLPPSLSLEKNAGACSHFCFRSKPSTRPYPLAYLIAYNLFKRTLEQMFRDPHSLMVLSFSCSLGVSALNTSLKPGLCAAFLKKSSR